jgi:hypothetical protein
MDFDPGFLIDRVIQEEGFYVYNMHNVVDKHFSISIVPVQSRGGSLVISIKSVLLSCLRRGY